MPSIDDQMPKSYPEFFMKPGGRLNKRRSEEEKRPIYDDIEMVRFRIPGDTKFAPAFRAHEPSSRKDENGRRLTFAELYHPQYERFRKQQEQRPDGTPIEVLPGLTPGKVSELKARNVLTIEQLAAIDGEAVKSLGMKGRDLKTLAEKYLESASRAANSSELMKENAELKKRLDALEETLNNNARQTPGKATTPPPERSPFDNWDIETLRVYYKDNADEDAKPGWNRATLMRRCEELAAKVRESNMAA